MCVCVCVCVYRFVIVTMGEFVVVVPFCVKHVLLLTPPYLFSINLHNAIVDVFYAKCVDLNAVCVCVYVCVCVCMCVCVTHTISTYVHVYAIIILFDNE